MIDELDGRQSNNKGQLRRMYVGKKQRKKQKTGKQNRRDDEKSQTFRPPGTKHHNF